MEEALRGGVWGVGRVVDLGERGREVARSPLS